MKAGAQLPNYPCFTLPLQSVQKARDAFSMSLQAPATRTGAVGFGLSAAGSRCSALHTRKKQAYSDSHGMAADQYPHEHLFQPLQQAKRGRDPAGHYLYHSDPSWPPSGGIIGVLWRKGQFRRGAVTPCRHCGKVLHIITACFHTVATESSRV